MFDPSFMLVAGPVVGIIPAVVAIAACSIIRASERREAAALLRNVVAHATGGHVDIAEIGPLSLNQICVEISKHRNTVYEAGKEFGRKEKNNG